MAAIVQEPNPVLRTVAETVPVQDIQSKEIGSVIAQMREALSREEDGVAIAAPQIGKSLRIFVVAQKAIKGATEDIAFINPEIVRFGKQKKMMHEGCLSVRWKYGMVKRSMTATVRAYNTQGNQFQMSGRGLLAQIFQHETDHLNGILFIDSAKNIEDIPPEQR